MDATPELSGDAHVSVPRPSFRGVPPRGAGAAAEAAPKIWIATGPTIYGRHNQELIDAGQLPGLNRAERAELTAATIASASPSCASTNAPQPPRAGRFRVATHTAPFSTRQVNEHGMRSFSLDQRADRSASEPHE